MENVFYNKYKNLHITNSLNSINPYELIKGDGIMLLSGDTEVVSKHIKFNSIIDNNIIVFNKLNTQSDYYSAHNSTYVNYDYENIDKIYCYYENGQYMPISPCSSYDLDISTNFRKHLYNLHKKNKKGKYISGKFIDKISNEEKEKEFNKNKKSIEVYSYLLFPTETEDMKVLVNFDINHDKDYLIYLEAMESTPKMKIPFFMSKGCYKLNICNMMDILNLEETKDIKWFKDLIMAKNYRTKQYIEDPKRNENLTYINNFLNSNFGKTSRINLVFENKEMDIKAYIEDNTTIISWKDKARFYNDGRRDNFSTQRYYMNGGASVIIDVDKEVSENLEFQEWYRIAYDIANFENRYYGINPITGDYYIDGEIRNENILYKDYEGIIAIGRYNSNETYIKKYGYYIRADEKEDIQEVANRMQVLENLKNAK